MNVCNCVSTQSDGNGPSGAKLEAETGKNSSIALPPPTIQVDLDAAQAVVQAVMAATSSNVYDLLKIGDAESSNAPSQEKLQNQDLC